MFSADPGLDVDKDKVAATGNQAFIDCAIILRDKSFKKTPSSASLLECFALLKQATEGDCNISKPGMFDVVGGFKYSAWSKIRGMSKEEAMQKAIELINKLASQQP